MHLESRGALLLVFFLSFYIHTHFFFSPSFFRSFIPFFFFSLFFILYPPWTLDYIVPTTFAASPMLRRLHVLEQRGGNFFVPR
jgi:hypothetical protein